MPVDQEQLKRWRLILGQHAQDSLARMGGCELSAEQVGMDEALAAIYDETSGEVDLTEQCGTDPVDMIFGVQLGGGTDINKSVAYCEKFITDPAQMIFFLITDLFEGGNEAQLVRRLNDMREKRQQCTAKQIHRFNDGLRMPIRTSPGGARES